MVSRKMGNGTKLASKEDVYSSILKTIKLQKSEEELEQFERLDHKCKIIEENNQQIIVFMEKPVHDSTKPRMRYSIPCKVEGQKAWDAELDINETTNFMTEEVLENLGFVHIEYCDYGRRIVKNAIVEIHDFTFLIDFYVLEYVIKGKPAIVFGRDFLVTTKSMVDFGVGEVRMNLTKLKEEENAENFFNDVMEEVNSSEGNLVKMGKANRNKNCNTSTTTPPTLKIEETPVHTSFPPPPLYRALTKHQKRKIQRSIGFKV